MSERNLSEKQELFCREYLIDRCAFAAYKRAGYKGDARGNSWNLLQKPYIRARIRQLARETGVAAIEEAIARSDANVDEEPDTGISLEKAVQIRREAFGDTNMQERLAAAMVTVERAQVEIACAALADRTLIFDDDGKLLKPHEWPPQLRACFDGVKYTRDGVEYKMVSKASALKMLGDALNLFSEHEKNRAPQLHLHMHPDDARA